MSERMRVTSFMGRTPRDLRPPADGASPAGAVASPARGKVPDRAKPLILAYPPMGRGDRPSRHGFPREKTLRSWDGDVPREARHPGCYNHASRRPTPPTVGPAAV